jgi:hypothetical protein
VFTVYVLEYVTRMVVASLTPSLVTTIVRMLSPSDHVAEEPDVTVVPPLVMDTVAPASAAVAVTTLVASLVDAVYWLTLALNTGLMSTPVMESVARLVLSAVVTTGLPLRWISTEQLDGFAASPPASTGLTIVAGH